MKKIFSLFLVLMMVMSLFGSTNALAEDPVEINVLARIWSPYKEDQRDIISEIEKACNVKFNIEWAPNDGYSERLYSTLASGKIPDLIARYQVSESSLLNEGAIVPLDEYLHLAPNYVAAIGEDIANLTNANDGHLYAISNIVDIPPCLLYVHP